MSIEFADPIMLMLADDLGGAMRGAMLETLSDSAAFFATAGFGGGGGSPGFLSLESLRSQPGVEDLLSAGSAGRDFAPGEWFEIPSSLAALSAGDSAYAYTLSPESAAATGSAPSPGGNSLATIATPDGDETSLAEAGSILLVTGPAVYAVGEDEGDLGEVVITGTRPPTPEVGDDETATGGTGPGDGGGGGTSETEQNDCRDRAALAATEEIDDENDNNAEEHASVIYRDPDGQIRHSPPIEGDTLGVPLSKMIEWMNANGVSMSQVVGFVHNHPFLEYGQTPKSEAVNRYPSIDDKGNGDWVAAERMVEKGAGGAGGANFALYVIDTAGKLREFAYSDRAAYESLSLQQRENGLALPDEIEDDGSACS